MSLADRERFARYGREPAEANRNPQRGLQKVRDQMELAKVLRTKSPTVNKAIVFRIEASRFSRCGNLPFCSTNRRDFLHLRPC